MRAVVEPGVKPRHVGEQHECGIVLGPGEGRGTWN